MPREIKFKLEDFLREAKLKHKDKFDYSKFTPQKWKDLSLIKCNDCGFEFDITPREHLNATQGGGCYSCRRKDFSANRRYTTKIFIEKANGVHFGKYDYSCLNYVNNKIKVEIICKKHGSFLQNVSDHLMGRGCPKCRSSRGEALIRFCLEKMSIIFQEQKRFSGCKIVKPLSFDFYVPSKNCCIEFDGKQHFEPHSWDQNASETKKQENFQKVKARDLIKTSFCEKEGIGLLRIPYWEIKNIEKILKERLLDF